MDAIVGVMEGMGYAGIALAVALENLFPPIPSEVILPYAGFLTVRGALHVPGVITAATVGSVAGALALYAVGLIFGRERVYWIVRRYGRLLTVSEAHVARAEAWFDRWGSWTVFFARMVPIVRSLISVPAGLARMQLVSFVLFTTVGTCLWNALLVIAGAALGAAWPRITVWVGYYQHLVLLALIAAAGFVLWRIVRAVR